MAYGYSALSELHILAHASSSDTASLMSQQDTMRLDDNKTSPSNANNECTPLVEPVLKDVSTGRALGGNQASASLGLETLAAGGQYP
eukprot:2060498-Rhodomonas_salina.2